MKKRSAVALALMMSLSLFVGCERNVSTDPSGRITEPPTTNPIPTMTTPPSDRFEEETGVPSQEPSLPATTGESATGPMDHGTVNESTDDFIHPEPSMARGGHPDRRR